MARISTTTARPRSWMTAIQDQLAVLSVLSSTERLDARYAKFRDMGRIGHSFTDTDDGADRGAGAGRVMQSRAA